MRIADSNLWQAFNLKIGKVWWRSALCSSPRNIETLCPKEWASKQVDNWAAIIKQGDKVFALTDEARSFPLLYADLSNEIVISSTISPLLDALPSPSRNIAAAKEFRHAGFVAGTDTLIEGVYSVPSGAVVQLFDGERITTAKHYGDVEYHATTTGYDLSDKPPMDFLADFYTTLVDATVKLIERAGSHQILVPLSGGADSRLFMVIFKELGAKNILTYTYGAEGTAEAQISRRVAEGLNYPWKFIAMPAQEVRKRWYRPETTSFLEDGWSANGLPHIQDWFALSELRKDPDVDPHGIVVPGHTVVGKEHDGWAYNPAVPFSKLDMGNSLVNHHFVLQGTPNRVAENEYSRAKLVDFLNTFWPDANPTTRAQVMIQYNILERQAKYINNSVRAYEHFGFQWALPMYYRNVWDAWFTSPDSIRGKQRRPYIEFTNQKYTEVSGIELPNFQAPAAKLGSVKKYVKGALDKIGLTATLNNLYRIKVERNHPLAYQAMAGNLTPRQIDKRLLSGQTMIGIYADLFLAGEWTPGGTVVPPESE